MLAGQYDGQPGCPHGNLDTANLSRDLIHGTEQLGEGNDAEDHS